MTRRHTTYYFPTRDAAIVFAQSIHAPTDRIIEYGRGFAIQWHKSGPYVGPADMTHRGCAWC